MGNWTGWWFVRLKGQYQLVILGFQKHCSLPGISTDIHFLVEMVKISSSINAFGFFFSFVSFCKFFFLRCDSETIVWHSDAKVITTNKLKGATYNIQVGFGNLHTSSVVGHFIAFRPFGRHRQSWGGDRQTTIVKQRPSVEFTPTHTRTSFTIASHHQHSVYSHASPPLWVIWRFFFVG